MGALTELCKSSKLKYLWHPEIPKGKAISVLGDCIGCRCGKDLLIVQKDEGQTAMLMS